MSIKFICSCGKHLRARDEMAARRSMCPRCGNPVGVPSLRPTHVGTQAAPLTPQERRRLRPSAEKEEWEARREEKPTTSPSLLSPPPLKVGRAPKVRRARHLEQHWYQCLAYPFIYGKVLLLFALVLSGVMMGFVLSVPNFPSFSLRTPQEWMPWAASVALILVVVGYAYATVECSLLTALAGQGPAFCWPSWNPLVLFKSCSRWLICFCAGPFVPASIAVYFWLFGGDLKLLDWVILVELGVVTMAYWILAIVSANERNRLRDANPMRVGLLVHRLKFRALLPVLFAPALTIAHVFLGLLALATLHEKIIVASLLLFGVWCSGLFWVTFLFRLLGVWYYRFPPAQS